MWPTLEACAGNVTSERANSMKDLSEGCLMLRNSHGTQELPIMRFLFVKIQVRLLQLRL